MVDERNVKENYIVRSDGDKNMLTHFSLCTGIGGLDLAAEWAGFETVGQCEIGEYQSKVLALRFQGVKNYHDVRTITAGRLRADGIEPGGLTVLSAGFPCQPYSLAGKGLGDGDERDLWGEVARCIGELRPKWFVGENTPGLFARAGQKYFRRILADLAALGYSVSWGIWGACDVGAPHKRDRVFIVAHADGERRPVLQPKRGVSHLRTSDSCGKISDATCERCKASAGFQRGKSAESRRAQNKRGIQNGRMQSFGVCGSLSDTYGIRYRLSEKQICTGRDGAKLCSWWQTEPDVGRVADGISSRVERLECLGNAVVPQQAYPIFEAIADYEFER